MQEESTPDIIDLDALVPEDKKIVIRFGGEELHVEPPAVVNILRLGHLSQKMGQVDSLSPEETQETLDALQEELKKCVPGLNGNLNLAQILKLVEIISELSMPKDSKILEERGITPDGPKVQ